MLTVLCPVFQLKESLHRPLNTEVGITGELATAVIANPLTESDKSDRENLAKLAQSFLSRAFSNSNISTSHHTAAQGHDLPTATLDGELYLLCQSTLPCHTVHEGELHYCTYLHKYVQSERQI